MIDHNVNGSQNRMLIACLAVWESVIFNKPPLICELWQDVASGSFIFFCWILSVGYDAFTMILKNKQMPISKLL